MVYHQQHSFTHHLVIFQNKMNTITIRDNIYKTPAHWEELQPWQIKDIAPYLLGPVDTLAIRQSAVLFYLLPAVKRFWYLHPWIIWLVKKLPNTGKAYPVLTEAQKWELLSTVNFLFNDVKGIAIVKQFKHNGENYYLPGDNFTRESIIAFAFADEYFNKFIETSEQQYLNLLIGCIARQRGSKLYPAIQFAEGDKREH